jgi:hypothetical protein
MPKRKEPELDPKEQFKRFQETAKEHGVDEGGKDIEAAFARLKPRSRGQESPAPKTSRRR